MTAGQSPATRAVEAPQEAMLGGVGQPLQLARQVAARARAAVAVSGRP